MEVRQDMVLCFKINHDKTIGIVICKQDNKYVIKCVKMIRLLLKNIN